MEDQGHTGNEGAHAGPRTWKIPSLRSLSKLERRFATLSEEYARGLRVHKKGRRIRQEIEGHYFSTDFFPRLILDLEGLQGQNCCHLLVHRKGDPYFSDYFYSRESGNSIRTSPDVTGFRKAFDLVRKGRSKVFGAQTVAPLQLNVCGTFMAKDFSFKAQDVVVVVSNNGFIPPVPEEVSTFSLSLDAIRPNLKLALATDGRNEKGHHLLLALNHYPFPLRISDGERDVFSNLRTFDLQDFPPKALTVPLDGGYKLSVAFKDDDSMISDFHHHQRIALLGELLNTLKHELSNPLFGLQLGADMLRQGRSNPETLEFIDAIAQNASRCQRIISNFQGLFGGQGPYAEVNLADLLHDTLKLAKSEFKGIQLKLHPVVGDASLDVKVNPTWIGQILFNLLINAAQACKQQGERLACIEVRVLRDDAARRIIISVSDNGPGIRPEYMNRLFVPFFTTKSDGTGLGLSICKRLAEKHNASISFTNNDPLPGATFSLNLPYANSGH